MLRMKTMIESVYRPPMYKLLTLEADVLNVLLLSMLYYDHLRILTAIWKLSDKIYYYSAASENEDVL